MPVADASPRPFFLDRHTDLDPLTPWSACFGLRVRSSCCSKLSVVLVEFSWASIIRTYTLCIFTMPHLPIASQFSSENRAIPPQDLEAGETSELDEKDRGSGTNTPSALLRPKDENITGENVHPGPSSEFVVWWNEPADQDPENPLNWSSRKKWLNILTIAVISFLV